MPDAIDPKLRFGILGAANIARTFIAGIAHSATVCVDAIASRSLPRSEEHTSELQSLV